MSSVLLSCQEIGKSYYARPLFKGLSFGVFDDDRLGIVGPNGAGKSTLLRIMAGLEEPDEGQIARRRQLRAAYVPQTASFAPGVRVLDATRDAAIAGGVPDDEADLRAQMILGQIGFADPEAEATSLSGGWRKRLSLACGMVASPDLLLLDEPTNHLDLEGILWLESMLKDASFAWVMVSHDRYLLERTVTKLAEVNKAYPQGVFLTEGSYSDFLTKRADWMQQQARLEETIANKVRREVEWLSRGPQARTTKSRYRIDEAHKLIEELSSLRQRRSTSETQLDFAASGRKTRRLVVADGISKAMGDKPLVKDLSLVLTPGLCLGIMGGNGSGKTTILKLLAKELAPDSGLVTHAEDLKVAYFDQNREQLDPAATLRSVLCESGGDSVVFQGRSLHVMTYAKRFQFRNEQLELPIADLSGGEQARALIARLMLRPADVLLLDEPTNDLDIPTLEVLEESLQEFPGAVVLVSHDRYLVNAVCNLVLGHDGRRWTLFGDCEQWEKAFLAPPAKAAPAPATPAAAAAPAAQAPKKDAKRLGYLEQREYDKMEADILDAETALAEQQRLVEDPSIQTSSTRLSEAYAALKKAQDRVDTLYARWAELESKTK
jgi:ATP-binding cassette subfamily F protein uup